MKSLSLALCHSHVHIITALKYESTRHKHIPRLTEGIKLNKLSHISAKTHSTVVLRPCHNQSIMCSIHILFRIFFILLFFYSSAGTFTLTSWHTRMCVVQENNIYSM